MLTGYRWALAQACAAVCCLSASMGSAETFSFGDQFSTTQNPSGPWNYLSVPTVDLPSAATPMIFAGTCCGGILEWQTTDSSDEWAKIGSNSFMHPGWYTDSLLGFTNPLGVTQEFNVSVVSVDGDNNSASDGKWLTMWQNDILLFGQYIVGDYSGSYLWQQVLTLGPSDSFYLRLNDAGGNNYADSQYEYVTISTAPTPEPSTAVLFGLGAMVLLALALRRKSPTGGGEPRGARSTGNCPAI